MRQLCFHSSWSKTRLSPSVIEHSKKLPIVQINNGTFYRRYPVREGQESPSNPPLFPGLNFSIPSFSARPEHWAVIGPSVSGKTTFLEILRGQHLCLPPTARSFPFLSSLDIGHAEHRFRSPASAIQYVGFAGEGGGMNRQGTRGAYLSARYESHREDTDFSVMDYLQGNITLNSLGDVSVNDSDKLEQVIKDFNLDALVKMPMGNLSNGQTRRARIAKALLGSPDVLLLDEPFMGLDPPTLTSISALLCGVANTSSPRVLLSLRPQDLLPDWITHVLYLGSNLRILHQGRKDHLPDELAKANPINAEMRKIPVSVIPKDFQATSAGEMHVPKHSKLKDWSHDDVSRDGFPFIDKESPRLADENETLVEMENVQIKYGQKQVLGGWKEKVNGVDREGLWWKIKRGERWAIFGPNGSGKTTLLSLISSDHPQSYSLPIKIFGRGRLPQLGQSGISIFDIQARIGQSSPEIHAFFPRNLTLRQTIENAWADTFLGTPQLKSRDEARVEVCLRWFEAELNPRENFSKSRTSEKEGLSGSTGWADVLRFREAPFSSQRVALFLRAIVKTPDLVILDEAFSGMDDFVRDKCLLFLAWGERRRIIRSSNSSKTKREIIISDLENPGATLIHGLTEEQALICVSHLKEEVPGVVRQWICLPDAAEGGPARFGYLNGPLEGNENGWRQIWGMKD